MDILPWLEGLATSAGMLGGGILGASVATSTEWLRRGAILLPVDPFQRVSVKVALKAIATILSRLFIVLAIMVLSGLFISRVGGLQSVTVTRPFFGIAFIVGVALGKTLRYIYWRHVYIDNRN